MTVMGPKRGDLEPALYLDVSDPTEVADLTTAVSWRLLGRLRDATSNLITDTNPTVTVDPAAKWKAVVKHTWVSGETATAGVLLFEVEAMFPGGRPQTFPVGGFIAVRIHDDLS